MLVHDPQIVLGMLIGGSILWAWGLWLIYIGKHRNSFIQPTQES